MEDKEVCRDLAPGIENQFAPNDAGVGVVNGKRLQANLPGKCIAASSLDTGMPSQWRRCCLHIPSHTHCRPSAALFPAKENRAAANDKPPPIRSRRRRQSLRRAAPRPEGARISGCPCRALDGRSGCLRRPRLRDDSSALSVDCAATSERSIGHPAVTAPATTNLMKSLRFALMPGSPSAAVTISATRARAAFAAHAQAVPEHNGHQRKHKNDGRYGVDLGRDAAPQPSPDFERQRVVAADQKKADGDLVHRKRENQQRRADNGQLQIRHGDAPECLPVVRAEIERGLFLRPVELLQAGEYFGGRHRDQRCPVPQNNRQQAGFVPITLNNMSSESPVIIPGRISGRSTNRRNTALPGNCARSSASAAGTPKAQRDHDRCERHLQAVEHRIPDRPRRRKACDTSRVSDDAAEIRPLLRR